MVCNHHQLLKSYIILYKHLKFLDAAGSYRAGLRMRIWFIVAGVATFMVQLTGNPVYDAMGSFAVGMLLAGTAIFLILQNRSLLIGTLNGLVLLRYVKGQQQSVSVVILLFIMSVLLLCSL